jgi:ubiquitin-like modifier-activating enzyme ATG7
MPIVQFAPFSSLIQPSFWQELTNIKIDVLRLSDEALPIAATYSTGRSVKDRETGQEIPLGCNLSLGSESFDKEFKFVSGRSSVVS